MSKVNFSEHFSDRLLPCKMFQMAKLTSKCFPLHKYTSHQISFSIAIIPNIGSIIFYNWDQWYLLFLWWVALLLDWPRYCRYQLWNTLFVPHVKEGNVVYCHFIFWVNIWYMWWYMILYDELCRFIIFAPALVIIVLSEGSKSFRCESTIVDWNLHVLVFDLNDPELD